MSPSDPSGHSLSWFPYKKGGGIEVSLFPLDAMLVHRRVTPALSLPVHLGEGRHYESELSYPSNQPAQALVRVQTRVTRSRVQCTNIRPPRLLRYINRMTEKKN